MRYVLCVLAIVLWCAAQAAQGPAVKTTPPTKAGMLALADKYIADVSPQLAPKQKTTVHQIFFILDSKRNAPTLHTQAVEELVNHLTIALAQTDGIEAVIVSSAHLAKRAPDHPRTANLFGVVLHTIGEDQDAIAVLEYARTLNPKSELIMLNAVQVYFDLEQGARAKAIIEKVLAQNPKNQEAWSALACYWHQQGDWKKALEAMLKAAALGGWAVQRKSDPARTVAEENEVTGDDNIETIEQKVAKVSTLTPNTIADLIEDQFPDAARQIRERYLKLIDDEKMIMPPLPQMNVSGAKNWLEKGMPYMEEWQRAFAANAENGMHEVTHLQTGINRGDSDKVKERKALIAANEKIEKQFADTERTIQMMEGMPGIPAHQLAEAKTKLKKAKDEARAALKKRMAEAGISSLTEGPEPPVPTVIASDADAEKIGADLVIPGFDYGSPFAVANYRTYLTIRNDYHIYFMKYYQKAQGDVRDILKVYAEKTAEEDKKHQDKIDELGAEAERMRQEAIARDEAFSKDILEVKYRQENLRYKRAINAISDDYFAQWSTYVFSRYDRKMKPMLDQYWATSALYIRNMNQPEVMKREYAHVKQTFWMYASMAVGMMNAGAFRYYPETYEEELQLERDIAKAKEDAAEEAKKYATQTKAADQAYVKWLEDNFALGIAGQFLSVKITPRQFIIEEYLFGMNFKHTIDFKTGEWTTTRSFAAKLDVGIQVGALKAGVSARADILESYDTYQIGNGKLVNCGSSFAKGSAAVNLSAGPVGTGGGVEVTLDPAAKSELSVKFTKSLGVKASPAKDVELGIGS